MIFKRFICCVAFLLMAACGDSVEDSGSENQGTTPAGSSSEKVAASDVPNACGVISNEDLKSLTGSDQGAATDRTAYPTRSVCQYASGTILAVEIGDNFGATRRIAEDAGIQTTDVAGVGAEAFTDVSGQVVAKGDKFFVGVVVPGADLETVKKVAVKMLEEIGS